MSPSGLSSNQKVNLYIYNVSKFSKCFHICYVIIHINSSGCLDILCRKHDFFFFFNCKIKKGFCFFFNCNFWDKNDFYPDEYQKSSESMSNYEQYIWMIKSLNKFARKQCLTTEISKPCKPQGLCEKTTSDYWAPTWCLDV